MRQISAIEIRSVAGGEDEAPPPDVQRMDPIIIIATPIDDAGDPNGCRAAILGSTGVGGAFGGGLGAIIGSIVPGPGTAFGAYMGALLVGSAAGAYTAANNPVCGGQPAP